jgi:4-carboxymuconolactone decarboxylase
MPGETPPGGWHPTGGARLRAASARPSLLGRALPGVARALTRGRTHQVFRVLALNRRLLRPYLAYNARLMPFGTLERTDTERIILRVAWRTRSEYEWRQHRRLGKKAGLGEGEIGRIATDRLDEVDSRTGALMCAVDELLDEHAIDTETWSRLKNVLRDDQILELCLLVGNYAMLAGALNTFQTPIEPPLLRA